MTRPTVQELVSGTGELATLPATVIRLLDLLQDDTACATEVQTVLERDPAMTANILKMSNSAYYGVSRSIGTLREALVLLGNRTVATLAFAARMAPVLRRDLVGYGLGRDEYWNHCLTTAAVSSLAADLGGNSPLRCQTFTAGLLHDMGMLVLDAHLVSEREYLGSAADDIEQCRLEIDRFGFDHAEVGAALADAWGFPSDLSSAIAYHHDPLRAPEAVEITRAVAAGDIVAWEMRRCPGEPLSERANGILASLGFDVDGFEDLPLDLAENLDDILTGAATPPKLPA